SASGTTVNDTGAENAYCVIGFFWFVIGSRTNGTCVSPRMTVAYAPGGQFGRRSSVTMPSFLYRGTGACRFIGCPANGDGCRFVCGTVGSTNNVAAFGRAVHQCRPTVTGTWILSPGFTTRSAFRGSSFPSFVLTVTLAGSTARVSSPRP